MFDFFNFSHLCFTRTFYSLKNWVFTMSAPLEILMTDSTDTTKAEVSSQSLAYRGSWFIKKNFQQKVMRVNLKSISKHKKAENS